MSDLSPHVDERAPFADFGGRRPAAFVDSRRHTARVQFLRRAIVICCICAVSLIGFILAFDPMHRLELGFSVGRVGLDGTRITMEKPRISGVRNDGQPYEIKAKTVVQDTKRPKIFELDRVDVKLGDKDGSTTHLEALKGVYDSDSDKLDLAGVVRIRNEGRYDMTLKSAKVDMKASAARSEEPVQVAITGGVVEAGGVDLSEREAIVRFFGGVHSSFEGARDEPDQQAGAGEAAQ
ncbi:MAG: LPS export ABC transporter periplasmic protein LptC [Hyphomicrobiales bacterium]|nr:LPS export ABC transporter periplasmic protein LptC [Hyphomicrobiales bacterium]